MGRYRRPAVASAEPRGGTLRSCHSCCWGNRGSTGTSTAGGTGRGGVAAGIRASSGCKVRRVRSSATRNGADVPPDLSRHGGSREEESRLPAKLPGRNIGAAEGRAWCCTCRRGRRRCLPSPSGAGSGRQSWNSRESEPRMVPTLARLLVPPGGPSDPRWRRSVHGTPELVMDSHHEFRVDSPPARCQAWPHERAARIQSLVVARLIGRPRLHARNPVSRAATERWTALFFA